MIILAIVKIKVLTKASHVWVLSSTNFKFSSIWSSKTLGNIPHFTLQPNIIKIAPVTKMTKEVHRERQQLQPMATNFVQMTLSYYRYKAIKSQIKNKELIFFGL